MNKFLTVTTVLLLFIVTLSCKKSKKQIIPESISISESPYTEEFQENYFNSLKVLTESKADLSELVRSTLPNKDEALILVFENSDCMICVDQQFEILKLIAGNSSGSTRIRIIGDFSSNREYLSIKGVHPTLSISSMKIPNSIKQQIKTPFYITQDKSGEITSIFIPISDRLDLTQRFLNSISLWPPKKHQ